jgi:glycosyl transferase family 4/glycosyl transferase family 1
MRKLLAVSWELPPMYGPRATQVARTLSQLASLGWHSTVVCLDPRRGGPHWRDGVDAAFPEGVETVRVSSPEEWTLVRAAWRVLPALRDWPDSKWVWIGRAARAATQASATTAFDGLVTFGQPWSDHLVGLRVHRATKLPWVAHFSDPWVDSPYLRSLPAQRRAAQRMEEDVIREADGVVFVTRQMADLVMKKYPDAWRDKAGVVPHGFEPASVPKAGQSRRAGGGPMRLVYTGRFYEDLRTPTSMLQALARINAREPLADALDVTFVGPHVTSFAREAARLGIDALVHFRDRVPPAEAAAVANAADALLVIDAPADGPSPFLPSKLVEYLPLRKPILGITPAGAAAELLERLVCQTAPPGDVDAIETAIVCLLRQWREGTLSVSPEFDRVANEFDIRHTTTQLAGLLTRAFARAC